MQTNAVLNAIQRSGTIWCGPSKWRGEAVIRISVSSYSTTKEDVDTAVEVIKRIADGISK